MVLKPLCVKSFLPKIIRWIFRPSWSLNPEKCVNVFGTNSSAEIMQTRFLFSINTQTVHSVYFAVCVCLCVKAWMSVKAPAHVRSEPPHSPSSSSFNFLCRLLAFFWPADPLWFLENIFKWPAEAWGLCAAAGTIFFPFKGLQQASGPHTHTHTHTHKGLFTCSFGHMKNFYHQIFFFSNVFFLFD